MHILCDGLWLCGCRPNVNRGEPHKYKRRPITYTYWNNVTFVLDLGFERNKYAIYGEPHYLCVEHVQVFRYIRKRIYVYPSSSNASSDSAVVFHWQLIYSKPMANRLCVITLTIPDFHVNLSQCYITSDGNFLSYSIIYKKHTPTHINTLNPLSGKSFHVCVHADETRKKVCGLLKRKYI